MIKSSTQKIGYQFLLAADEVATSSGYSLIKCGSLSLLVDSKFHCVPLHNGMRELVGYIIGFPYHQTLRKFIISSEVIAYDALLCIRDSNALESELLPKLAGSYFVVTFGSFPARIYPDHIGSIPILYDRVKKIITSSVAMIFDNDEYVDRINKGLYERMVVGEGSGGWIPGTLTAHSGVERVLPNHYLAIEEGVTCRYWPKEISVSNFMGIDKAVDQVISDMTAFSSACFSAFNTAQTLTAGNDTRLLLAVSRGFIGEIDFFTIEAEGNRIDVDIATDLSKKYSFKHKVIPLIHADEHEKELWDKMVGHSVLEINREIYPTLDQVSSDFIITGPCGALGRSFYYKNDTERINEIQLDVDNMYARFRIPSNDEVYKNMSSWFDALPNVPNSIKLDLAYLELRGASWGMGQNSIQNSRKYNLMPFFSRPVIEAFLLVDPEEKKNGEIFKKAIERAWPGLLSIPINKYGDYRDYLVVLRKILNPSKLRRYLRGKLSKHI